MSNDAIVMAIGILKEAIPGIEPGSLGAEAEDGLWAIYKATKAHFPAAEKSERRKAEWVASHIDQRRATLRESQRRRRERIRDAKEGVA